MSDKLAGIAPGDRVRVTFEGTVDGCGDAQVEVIPDGGALNHIKTFRGDVLEASTFQIERIEPPLQVGQMIRNRGEIGVILALGGTFAWVKMHTTNAPVTLLVSDLERIA